LKLVEEQQQQLTEHILSRTVWLWKRRRTRRAMLGFLSVFVGNIPTSAGGVLQGRMRMDHHVLKITPATPPSAAAATDAPPRKRAKNQVSFHEYLSCNCDRLLPPIAIFVGLRAAQQSIKCSGSVALLPGPLRRRIESFLHQHWPGMGAGNGTRAVVSRGNGFRIAVSQLESYDELQ